MKEWQGWEEINTKVTSDGYCVAVTYRMKVPNGWVLRCMVLIHDYMPASTICFIPDLHFDSDAI